jgi:asparagine synthase (glutamine-hydrolysing)
MCRIHGYFGGEPVDRAVLHRVSRAMLHGGPDAQTLWTGEDGALGSNRLAIQGIPDGDQPFTLGELVCVFNGEIYNHRQLRAMLADHGYRLDGDCDGNVLLPLYQLYGDAFVDRLEGMFAIAIIDRRTHSLALFTDPAGMKSVYYFLSAGGSRLSFAQELQALSVYPDFPDEIDPLAVDRYLGGRAVWGPGTIYSGVRTLEPGCMLRFDGSRLTVRAGTPVAAEPAADTDLAGAAARLDGLLQHELSRMLDADVPVCVITSGGLDSSYLTALARQQVPDLASFNIAYVGDWPSDERAFAAEVAAHCGTDHHQVLIHPDTFAELTQRFIRHLDQPNNAPHSLSTYALFEAIHQAGFKVALTGDGADELFSGYARYVRASRDDSPDWHRQYQDTMAAVGSPLLRRLYQPEFQQRLLAEGGFFADRSGDELARRVQAEPAGKLETILRYDQYQRFPYYILRRVDHLSMGHSVEARIPFLQPSIVRFAHGLPASLKVAGSQVKAPVAEAARRWLPPSIISRPKQPFTLPIAAMMVPGQAIYDLIGDVLITGERRCAELLRQDGINELFRLQTKEPTGYAADALWSLLMLELWLAARSLRP